MGKVMTSFFRAADPSSTVYVRPNQTFPTAALVDYVVNREAKPQVTRKVSFITSDNYNSYNADLVGESGNYLGAPADDCVDFKAANYILQRRLSLQYDSD